jgi:UDP-glucose 4-epimerase
VIDSSLLSSFRAKRVLITGGLGFIGSNLARALVEAGSEVVLVDSLVPEYGGNLANVAGLEGAVRINISDVRDEHSFRHLIRDQDILFNLAGQTSHLDSMVDPFTDLEINCRSQLSILEACRHHNPEVVVVFASTRQIYGRPQFLPVDERHPIAPVDVNGVHKAAGEWYHLLYSQAYGIRVSVLRLTNTYGPRMRVKDDRQTFLGSWLKAILRDEPLTIFGDGRQQRDFTYVDDAVRALLLVAARSDAWGQVFNLGGERPVSLLELAQVLVRVRGGGNYELVEFPRDRKAIDIGDYYADYSKIRHGLGWQPEVPLEEGLARSLSFYGEHGEHYWNADI